MLVALIVSLATWPDVQNGQVVDELGVGAPGVSVELWSRAPSSQPIATLETNDDGSFSFSIPEGLTKNDCQLALAEPGYQRTVRVSDPTREARLVLEPGGTIHLSVTRGVDASPVVRRAKIYVSEAKPGPDGDYATLADSIEWNESRRTFDVHFHEPARARVHVSNGGTALLEDIELDTRHDRTYPVYIPGNGWFRGVALDENCQPLAFEELVALPDDYRSWRRDSSVGATTARTITGPDGSFEFSGLEWTQYIVRRASVPEDATFPARVDAMGQHVDLVFGVPRAMLRIVDEDGDAITEGLTWCLPLGRDAEANILWSRRSDSFGGLWSFPIEPGQRYSCGWKRDGALIEEVFDAPLDGGSVEFVFERTTVPPPVRLTVEEYSDCSYEAQIVSVRSSRSRVTLAEARRWSSDWCVFDLPPGEYRVSVTPSPTQLCGLSPVLLSGCHEEELVVQLAPATNRTVSITTRPGGRVDVDVILAPGLRDSPFVAAPGESEHEFIRRRMAMLLEPEPDERCSRLYEVRTDGTLRHLSVLVDGALNISSAILPGTKRLTHAAFAPGRHTFVLKTLGFRDELFEVDVKAGEVAPVRVQLQPL